MPNRRNKILTPVAPNRVGDMPLCTSCDQTNRLISTRFQLLITSLSLPSFSTTP